MTKVVFTASPSNWFWIKRQGYDVMTHDIQKLLEQYESSRHSTKILDFDLMSDSERERYSRWFFWGRSSATACKTFYVLIESIFKPFSLSFVDPSSGFFTEVVLEQPGDTIAIPRGAVHKITGGGRCLAYNDADKMAYPNFERRIPNFGGAQGRIVRCLTIDQKWFGEYVPCLPGAEDARYATLALDYTLETLPFGEAAEISAPAVAGS